ncbi:MAG: hypothetical protein VW982_02575 [Candidatus Poseidoniales archaeon]
MTEAHVMTVRWSGDASLAKALAAAASEHGHAPLLEQVDDETTLSVEVQERDLQALRDRVDALLVAFSALEEEHNG